MKISSHGPVVNEIAVCRSGNKRIESDDESCSRRGGLRVLRVEDLWERAEGGKEVMAPCCTRQLVAII